MKRKLISLLLGLILFSSSEVFAAVVCGTASTDVAETDPQTVTYTPGAGSNRVVIVAANIRGDGRTINGVSSSAGGTFTEFANIVSSTTGQRISAAIFYSTDFADGSQTISVDYDAAAVQSTIAVITCTGVNTSSPWRGAATTLNTNGTSASISVPSAVNDLVLDFLGVASINTGDIVIDGSQAALFTPIDNGGGNLDTSMSSEAGVDGNVTMSETWSGSTSEIRVHIGGSLVPAAAVTDIPSIIIVE